MDSTENLFEPSHHVLIQKALAIPWITILWNGIQAPEVASVGMVGLCFLDYTSEKMNFWTIVYGNWKYHIAIFLWLQTQHMLPQRIQSKGHVLQTVHLWPYREK